MHTPEHLPHEAECKIDVIAMDNLYAYSVLLVIFVGLSIVLATSEIGWQLGVRADGRGGNNISALEQSLLGLLALMIGFTFLMALTRFEERREAVLNEANTIGTTALRARLLSEPHRTEILKLLREYAQIRVDYIPSGKSFAELPTIIGRSNAIHEALWQQAKAAAAQDKNMVPTGLFIQALNDMIDNQGKRLAALRPQTARSLLRSLPTREMVEIGGLLSYGVNYPRLYFRAAGLIDKIFKGASPGDLPVEQPTKLELLVNLRTAKALGLELPPTLIARADEVIE